MSGSALPGRARPRVHQILATLGYGDAIGHEVLGIARALRAAGYESEIIVEAAEQCGETFVLDIARPVRLDALLDAWDPARRLLFCDETRAAPPAATALAAAAPGPWAILVGPEGGFAPEETQRLRALPFVVPATLGPRVLRADTAAVAAIALWQALLGDWR